MKPSNAKDYIIGALTLLSATLAILLGMALQSRPVASQAAQQAGAGQPTAPTGAPAAAATSPAVPAKPVAPMAAGGFTETFDGQPASPTAWQAANWDITVHSRDRKTWDHLQPMHAEHGMDCGAPPATHETQDYENAVFQCRDHLMTAINANGYGVIYLTPDQMVDFSQEEAVIRFDLSTARSSARDWVDIWITPYQENLQLPLEDFLPDLSGEPRNALHFRMSEFNDKTVFSGRLISDFKAQEIKGGRQHFGYEQVLTPSATQRETFEIRISRDHVVMGLPAYDLWWIDGDIPALDWTQGVVQFGHHSYNPGKSCDSCGPNTWHWDNISIAPAAPFAITHANKRFVDVDTDPGVTFASPAPTNAHLRFAGIGSNLQVSLDGGSSWQPAQLQDQEEPGDDQFSSFWMPIPAGTTGVQFRGEKWWGGNWMVRDISLWSQPASS